LNIPNMALRQHNMNDTKTTDGTNKDGKHKIYVFMQQL